MPNRHERIVSQARSSAGSPRVTELPVDHRRESALVDDQVAEPEVAVDEPRLGTAAARSARSQRRPASTAGERLADRVELRLPELAGVECRVDPASGRPSTSAAVDASGSARARRRAAPAAARGRSRARRGAAPAARPRSRRRTPSGSPRPSRTARRRARRRRSARPRPRPGRRPRSRRARPRARRTTSRPGLAAQHAARLAAGATRNVWREAPPSIGLSSTSPGSSPASASDRAHCRGVGRAQSPRVEPMAREVAFGDVGRVLVPVPGARIAIEVLRRVATDTPGGRSSGSAASRS